LEEKYFYFLVLFIPQWACTCKLFTVVNNHN
jgi:hypothetical protein